jgi:hypothetical protein
LIKIILTNIIENEKRVRNYANDVMWCIQIVHDNRKSFWFLTQSLSLSLLFSFVVVVVAETAMHLCSFVPTVVLALLLTTPNIESFQFRRTLQENDIGACSAPIEDALLNLGDGNGTMINSDGIKIPLSVIRSSFYEDCIKSLEVDKDKMIQHVTELRQMLRQHQ